MINGLMRIKVLIDNLTDGLAKYLPRVMLVHYFSYFSFLTHI